MQQARLLYRLLTHEETGRANTRQDAFNPKDPDPNCTALQHILDSTLKSQYISMTSDFECAKKLAFKAMEGRRKMKAEHLFIAKIDFYCEDDRHLIDLTDTCEVSRSHRDENGVSADKKASHCTK